MPTARATPGRWPIVSRFQRRLVWRLSKDGPLLVMCLALIVFGVWLRIVDIGFPNGLTFDEHHFVLNARNYIEHKFDWNDHPPLGKLLIVPWMLVFGDTSTTFRLNSLAFGLASILLARALANVLYRDRRAGWLAAAFVAADGFCISFSRTALLDTVETALILLAAWLTVTARSALRVALAAVVIGLAANVKESAFAIGLPVALFCLFRPQPVLRIATLALAPVAFIAAFCFGLRMAHSPSSIADAWKTAAHFLKLHHDANQFANPLTSHWYTWFVPIRPIVMDYQPLGKYFVRAMSSLGNLALWWAADIALIVAAVLTVRALRICVKARSVHAHVGRTSRATIVMFSFVMSMLAPWIIGSQDSYMYHYLPVYTLLLPIVAGLAAHLYRSHRSHRSPARIAHRIPVLAFVCITALVSAFYAPLWGKLPLTPGAFEERLPFPSWR